MVKTRRRGLERKLLIGNNSVNPWDIENGGDPIPTPFFSMVNQVSERTRVIYNSGISISRKVL
jgi:hypothetical protein